MALSGYQIQMLIRGFRRLHGRLRAKEHEADPVALSAEARRRAPEAPALAAPPEPAEVGVRDVRDETPYPALVVHELERRAGSFMAPPYLPYKPPQIRRGPPPESPGAAGEALPPETEQPHAAAGAPPPAEAGEP